MKRTRGYTEPENDETWADFLSKRANAVHLARKQRKRELEIKKAAFEESVRASRPFTDEKLLEVTIEKCMSALVEKSGEGFGGVSYMIGPRLEIEDFVCDLFNDERLRLAKQLCDHLKSLGKGLDVGYKNCTVYVHWDVKRD